MSGMLCKNASTNISNMADRHTFARAHVSVFICLGVLGATAILSNSVVVYLYKRKAFLKTKTNLCLVCLAVSDMLAGLIAVPMVISCNLVDVDLITSLKICTAMDLASRFISVSTVLHLLLVTMERYCMIIHALYYPFIVTTSRLKRVLFCVWCFSLAASLIQLTWIPIARPSTEDVFKIDAIYSLTIFFGIVVPSLFAVGTALGCIFQVLRTQHKTINSVNGSKPRACRRASILMERKAAFVFGSMILTFIACWFSYFLDGLVHDLRLDVPHLPHWARVVLMFLRFSSSVVNPLLYTFLKEDFKRAFRACFGRTERSRNMTTWNTTSR